MIDTGKFCMNSYIFLTINKLLYTCVYISYIFLIYSTIFIGPI